MVKVEKVLIIAEAGVNHNGSIEIAKQLIDEAAAAKVDYVKFQTFKAENLVNINASKAEYQKNNTEETEGQYQMLKKLELDVDKHLELIKYSKIKGVKFLSTAFDLESIDMLDRLGIDIFKIPSGEITNKRYLEKVAGKEKPIILSTGMSTIDEIQSALNVLLTNGAIKQNITILHCNTEYPTPMEDVNLRAMKTIENRFDVKIGYSDHTLGIEVPIAAVALGAICIEKHFTLDRSMVGPDHRASLEPKELMDMVIAIRNIEQALGLDVKKPSKSENKNIHIARKSLHFTRDIVAGDVVTESDLIALRPGNGISPMLIDELLGITLNRNVKKGDRLIQSMFK